jgi:hypothetical protein
MIRTGAGGPPAGLGLQVTIWDPSPDTLDETLQNDQVRTSTYQVTVRTRTRQDENITNVCTLCIQVQDFCTGIYRVCTLQSYSMKVCINSLTIGTCQGQDSFSWYD